MNYQTNDVSCQLIDSFVKSQPHIRSWEDLWQYSEACRIPDVMPFGKHKDTPIKDMPRDDVEWYRHQETADPYIIKAMQMA